MGSREPTGRACYAGIVIRGLNRISTFSHPTSLLVWLALQLLVLLLPVLQVPLSDEFPRPAERLAIEEMVIAQIALSSLLLSYLLRDMAATFVIAASTWPFLLLAGLLSSTSSHRLLQVGAFISIWLMALGLLRSDSRKWNAWTTSIISTISIGGALAAYLRSEFSSGPVNGLLFGPIISALDLLHGPDNHFQSWLILPLFLIVATVLRITFHRLPKSSRQVIHNFGG